MYYKEMYTDELVHEDDVYEYAKEHLDEMSNSDKREFAEWFFSAESWEEKTDEEVEEQRKLDMEAEWPPNYSIPMFKHSD